jgi:hypothetical protein
VPCMRFDEIGIEPTIGGSQQLLRRMNQHLRHKEKRCKLETENQEIHRDTISKFTYPCQILKTSDVVKESFIAYLTEN